MQSCFYEHVLIATAAIERRERCADKMKSSPIENNRAERGISLLEHEQQRCVPVTDCWKMFLIAALIWTVICGQACIQQAADKNMRMSKISAELIALYQEYSNYLGSRQTGGFKTSSPLVQVVDDRVIVDAVSSSDANILKSDLQALGMQYAVVFGRNVSGELPILAIPSMATLPSLNSARAASAILQGESRSLPPGTANR